ncbi:MAG TPA: hypothetical protein VLH75_06170 [Longimicrobiales bacterium]|nr:hypothetical protein [Longimicrobiales bacterium]
MRTSTGGGRSTAEAIKARQRRWAEGEGIALDRRGYAERLEDNLFLRRLQPKTEEEFRAGDGAELEDSGARPAKMRALHSSSALAVNFFDAWRDEPVGTLLAALGIAASEAKLEFECKCESYPVPPRAPNLDLCLTLDTGDVVGIESKFLEPYGPHEAALSTRYFKRPEGYWSRVHLPGAQGLADALAPQWHFLDVPQLLKHMLGIAHAHAGAQALLLYLWYDPGTAEAEWHREEVERFTEGVAGDAVAFRALTYQELFSRLDLSGVGPNAGWTDYIRRRYIET